jgi:hypothetical protein
MPHRPRRPASHRSRVVLVLLPLLLVLGAAPAAAQAVSCGAILTEDTTLTADLLNCQGTGLVIGADGITVDLGGHRVEGSPTFSGAEDAVAIDNSAGHDDVTIRNGSTQYFNRGHVLLAGADRNRVLDLDMTFGDEFGILLQGGSGNRFAGNSMLFAGDVGIGVYGTAAGPSQGNVITGNRLESLDTAGILLRFETITGTVVEDNEVMQSGGGAGNNFWHGGIVVSYSVLGIPSDVLGTVVRRNTLGGFNSRGVFVGGAAEDTLVERNTVDNTFGPSIQNNGDRTLVRRNAVRSSISPGFSGTGIQVDAGAEGTRVEANTVDRVATTAVDDLGTRTAVTANLITGQIYPSEPSTGFWAGIVVREEASDGRIQANVVRRQSGGGIEVSGDNMRIIANVVDQTDLFEDGIRVAPAATGTLVKANVTTRSGDDGIDVDNPATTVTANVANNNRDLGIEAVDGVTDAGGNRARGNGNPSQCVGVACS